jgi:RNA polymerase sigma factor (sigma-70 family)
MDAMELYYENEYLVRNTLLKMYANARNFAHSNGLEFQDLEQFARIGLWKACATYTKEKETSKFRSFAIRNIRWFVLVSVRKYRTNDLVKKNKGYIDGNKVYVLSMSQKPYADDEDETTFYDIVSSDNIYNFNIETVESKVQSDDEYINILNLLTDEEKELVNLKTNEYLSYAEIGQRYGCSKQWVGVKFKKIQSKINRYLNIV